MSAQDMTPINLDVVVGTRGSSEVLVDWARIAREATDEELAVALRALERERRRRSR